MKTCHKCGEIKSTTEFNKNTTTRDGLQTACKVCKSTMNAKWRKANPQKTKAHVTKWRAANRDKVKATMAAYRAANSDKRKANFATWRAANVANEIARSAQWRAENPDKAKENSASWKAANPEARRIHEHNRRARKRANGGKLSPDLAATCSYCARHATCRRAQKTLSTSCNSVVF